MKKVIEISKEDGIDTYGDEGMGKDHGGDMCLSDFKENNMGLEIESFDANKEFVKNLGEIWEKLSKEPDNIDVESALNLELTLIDEYNQYLYGINYRNKIGEFVNKCKKQFIKENDEWLFPTEKEDFDKLFDDIKVLDIGHIAKEIDFSAPDLLAELRILWKKYCEASPNYRVY